MIEERNQIYWNICFFARTKDEVIRNWHFRRIMTLCLVLFALLNPFCSLMSSEIMFVGPSGYEAKRPWILKSIVYCVLKEYSSVPKIRAKGAKLAPETNPFVLFLNSSGEIVLISCMKVILYICFDRKSMFVWKSGKFG